MKRIVRVVAALAAALAVALALAPAAAKAEVLYTDKWGSCPWEITDDGVLTVHPGTGASAELSGLSPWNSYRDLITAVVFLEESGQKVIAPENVSNLFSGLTGVESIDLSGFETSNVTNMSMMFAGCSSLTTLDLNGFDTSNVRDMMLMFWLCKSLKSLNLGGWDTRNVGSSYGIFMGAAALKELTLGANFVLPVEYEGGLKTLNGYWTASDGVEYSGDEVVQRGVADTYTKTRPGIVYGDTLGSCVWTLNDEGLLRISPANGVSGVLGDPEYYQYEQEGDGPSLGQKSHYYFPWAYTDDGLSAALIESMMPEYAVRKVVVDPGVKAGNSLSGLFYGCTSLVEADLSYLDVTNVTDMSDAFYGCSALVTIYASTDWPNGSNVTSSEMFKGCTALVGGNGQTYGYPYDGTRARIDRDGAQGYFTYKEGVLTDISGATIAEIPNQTFVGSEITPELTVALGDKVLVKDTDYTVAYSNNVNVGTATVTIAGKGNFTGTATGQFTISAASISGATIAAIADQAYTGSAIEPAVSVTFNGKTLVRGTDYTIAYSNNVSVGTATVTVTGKGNFTGTKSATFKIVEAKKTGWQRGSDGSWYYYDDNGAMMKESWVKSGGAWYYMGSDGKMVANAWVKSGGAWYYMGSDGKMVASNWVNTGGAWYYMGSDGKMVANNWVKSGGAWYYMGSDGKMVANAWVKSGGAWYYMGSNGKMVANNWVKYNGKYYYMNGSGNPVTNSWQKISGKWYHFNASGVCDKVYNG